MSVIIFIVTRHTTLHMGVRLIPHFTHSLEIFSNSLDLYVQILERITRSCRRTRTTTRTRQHNSDFPPISSHAATIPSARENLVFCNFVIFCNQWCKGHNITVLYHLNIMIYFVLVTSKVGIETFIVLLLYFLTCIETLHIFPREKYASACCNRPGYQ